MVEGGSDGLRVCVVKVLTGRQSELQTLQCVYFQKIKVVTSKELCSLTYSNNGLPWGLPFDQSDQAQIQQLQSTA
ncbi:hypothetical protein T08_3878 [Trichinella sp. T8]|nr:hypothetical protein T08_3878 [Trichinella sp. T8]